MYSSRSHLGFGQSATSHSVATKAPSSPLAGTMVARALVLDALAGFLEATEDVDRTNYRRLVDGIADAVEAHDEAIKEKIRALRAEVEQLRGKPAGEDKKDRKRAEPKDPFDGKNLIEWEWKQNNHMEVTFGSRGRHLMK